MAGRLNLILAIATAIMGMMGYQTFSQVPDLKTKVTHNEDNLMWLKDRHAALSAELAQLNARVTVVEARLKVKRQIAED